MTYSLEEKSKMLDIPVKDLKEHGLFLGLRLRKWLSRHGIKTQSDYGVGLTGCWGQIA